ncbi:MAG: MBOAT family protein [Clostridia bacterium]|nr:MBOAT family protein [Clostridia bacterium]
MNFNSLAFLIYLPIVTGIHWALPHRFRKYWLLAASWFFYMYWNPALIVLLLFSTAVDYFCGLGLSRVQGKGQRRALLLTSMCANLGLLFFFKYADFFGGMVNDLASALGLAYRVPALNLILPVGISFYTFQTMSYTIDVYRGKFPAERDPVMFALYVTFFPQLVAGPIETPGALLPQLKKERTLTWADADAGVRLLLSGFFRKCAVADICGIYVNRVFASLASADTLAVAAAGFLFCIQMYCDFAGYSEIAMGAARLLGVRLTKNFDQPYLSQSYGEFFRRWHITLNRWFTQYVYIPLGGSRRGRARQVRNTVIVFALCGLWHGPRWTYILWGLYAAFFVCLESVLKGPAQKLVHKCGIRLEDPGVVLFRRLYMMLIFLPAALVFRAPDLPSFFLAMRRLFSGVHAAQGFALLGLTGPSLLGLTVCLLAMARLGAYGAQEMEVKETSRMRYTLSLVLMGTVTVLSVLALMAGHDMAGFAYFQF